MSDDFNPYKQWLGLDDNVTSPNYYELLGIETYEEDPAVISQAADRAKSRVRSFRPGPHARHWACVLDELSRAKACLTDRVQKQQYDEQLRRPPSGLRTAAPATEDDTTGHPVNVNPDLYPPGVWPPNDVPTAIVLPQTMIVRALKVDDSPGDAPPGNEAVRPSDSLSGSDPTDPMAPYRAELPVSEAEPDSSQSTVSAELWSGSSHVPLPPAEASADPNAASQQRSELAASPSPVKDATRRAGQHSHLPLVTAGAITLILVTLGVLYSALGERSELADKVDTGPTRATREQQASGPSVPQAARSPQPHPTATSAVSSPADDTADMLQEMLNLPVDPGSGNEPGRDVPDAKVMPPQSSTAAAPSVPRPEAPVPPVAAMPTPTREEIVALGRAVSMARTALSEKNLDLAAAELDRAAALAKTPEQQQEVARLRLLAEYVRRYVNAVDAGRAVLDAGHELKISDTTIVLVVESRADLLIVRVAGVNRRYPPKEIPTVLALLIADRVLPPDDPETWLIKGAAYAIDKDEEQWAEARSLWERGRQAGASVEDLMKVLDEQ